VAEADLQEDQNDRCLFMFGFGEVTSPEAVSHARVDKKLINAMPSERSLIEETIELRRRRRQAFQEHLKARKYWFRDICPEKAIERLALTGAYPRDDALRQLGAERADGQARREHLEAVIKLLRDNKNYDVGILAGDFSEIERTDWLVKRGHRVFIEIWPRDTQGFRMEKYFSIDDKDLVENFYEYFNYIWYKWPNLIKDKDEVIEHIQRQINRIPDNSGMYT